MYFLHVGYNVNDKLNPCYGCLVDFRQAVYEQRVKEVAMAVPLLCCAFDTFSVAAKRQIIIAGVRNSPDTDALMTACHAPFDPDKNVIAPRSPFPFNSSLLFVFCWLFSFHSSFYFVMLLMLRCFWTSQ